MSQEKLISVVMPVFYSGSCLHETLEAFCNINYPKCRIEVIFSYYSSKDSTLDVIKEFKHRYERDYFDIKILESQQQGVSCGRNLGIRNSYGNYIFLTDDDIALHDETFEHALNILERRSKAAAVTFPYAPLRPGIIKRATIFYYEGRVTGTRTVATGCTMIRKSVLDEVGLFNEKMGYPYSVNEDLELAARVKKAGYDIIMDGTLTQIHLPKKRVQRRIYMRTGSEFGCALNLLKAYFSDFADSYHLVLLSAPASWRLELAMYFLLPIPLITSAIMCSYPVELLYISFVLSSMILCWRVFNLRKLPLAFILLTGRTAKSYGYVTRMLARRLIKNSSF